MPQPNTNKTPVAPLSWILENIEITIGDAAPEELPGLHAKLLALTEGLEARVDTAIAEARKEEHAILQHQAFNVLKTAKAVGEWSEMRVEDIEDKSDE